MKATAPGPSNEQAPAFPGPIDDWSLDAQEFDHTDIASGSREGSIDESLNSSAQSECAVVLSMVSAQMEVINEEREMKDSNHLSPRASECQAPGNHGKGDTTMETDGQDNGRSSPAQTQSTASLEIRSCEASLEAGSAPSLLERFAISEQERSTEGYTRVDTINTHECAGVQSTTMDYTQESACRASEAGSGSRHRDEDASMFRQALLAAVQAIGSIVEDSRLTDNQAIEKLRSSDLLELSMPLVPQKAMKEAGSPPRRKASTGRKRQAPSDAPCQPSKWAWRRSPRRSQRRLVDGMLINTHSPYLVDTLNHPVSRYLDD
jgi:hypothetical protein